jgi:allophanate hydrolase subunit 1
MTKVQLRFALERKLDEILMRRIAEAHSIFGINRIEPAPHGLTVDYDASRLTEDDVEAALRRAGLPVRRLDEHT